MAKLIPVYHDDKLSGYAFFCPGCRQSHKIYTKDCPNPGYPEVIWEFSGDLERPTLSPSVLVRNIETCHTFIKDGNIQYLGDCTHLLAGQTVPLPDIEKEIFWWDLPEYKDK